MTRRKAGMRGRLKRLWQRAPVLTLVIGGAALLVLIFALRLSLAVWHWSAAPTDPELAGWMTPRFVAHSWDVPPEVILQTLPIAPDGSGRRVTLEELAKAHDLPLARVFEALHLAIAEHRAGTTP